MQLYRQRSGWMFTSFSFGRGEACSGLGLGMECDEMPVARLTTIHHVEGLTDLFVVSRYEGTHQIVVYVVTHQGVKKSNRQRYTELLAEL